MRNKESIQKQLDVTSSGIDRVMIASEFALSELGATNESSKRSSGELYKYITDTAGLDLRIGDCSFSPYLSNAIGSAKSAIVSTGRGRSGGYYLSTSAKQVTAKTTPVKSDAVRSRSEESLYPVFHKWLIGQCYAAKVTASMRSLGKWSNPDVTGLRVGEHLGRIDIEVATIEAKRDLADWERVFFESVSHRRFANRAYFAFPLPESSNRKLPEDMRYYSELYNVGILVLTMSDEDYAKYQSGKQMALDGYDASDVSEVITARSSQVPLNQQRVFCEALGITDTQSLLKFGE